LAGAIGGMNNPASSGKCVRITYCSAFAERNNASAETGTGESRSVDAGRGIEALDEFVKNWCGDVEVIA